MIMFGKGLRNQAMTAQNGRIKSLLKFSTPIVPVEKFQLPMQAQLDYWIPYNSIAE